MPPSRHRLRWLANASLVHPVPVWSRVTTTDRSGTLSRSRFASVRRRSRGEDSLSPEESKQFETSDRWVRRFIGFSERRFAADGEGTFDLGLKAARRLFEHGPYRAADVDAVIVASVTPTYLYSPPDAALLQHELGIPVWQGAVPREVKGADLSLACSSWVASLTMCYALIRSGMARSILLVGADRMSAAINWRDRSFATVLGDAGTATLCLACPEEEDWFSPKQFWSWLDGSGAGIILTPVGGSRNPYPSPEELDAGRDRLAMDGAAVRKVMVPFVGGPAIAAALARAGWTMPDLDLVALHEANLVLNASILAAWTERGFRGKIANGGGRFGNTTSASIPLALSLHAADLAVGTRFGLFGFGGGLSASFALGTVRHPVQVTSAEL